ncbi:MAG: hypothetical protein DRP03_02155 [Candidatus Aenigmatarchaeota archaeon]|nr:MAG: hypothetical protein DRP03_02155 [Candidatus Aenigmarchaeota archaeon]
MNLFRQALAAVKRFIVKKGFIAHFFPEGFFEEALAPVKKGSMGPAGFPLCMGKMQEGTRKQAPVSLFASNPRPPGVSRSLPLASQHLRAWCSNQTELRAHLK